MATHGLMQAATMLTAASGRLDDLHHPSGGGQGDPRSDLDRCGRYRHRGYASRSQVGDLARLLHPRGSHTGRGNREV